MIESSIRTYLLSKSSITDLVGQRIYYMRAPEIVTYPYIAFYVLSNPEERVEIGQDGSRPIFTFKAVAKDSLEVVQISNAIRSELRDLRSTTLSGDYIYHINKVGARDFTEDDDMGNIEYYVRTDDYEVIYNI